MQATSPYALHVFGKSLKAIYIMSSLVALCNGEVELLYQTPTCSTALLHDSNGLSAGAISYKHPCGATVCACT